MKLMGFERRWLLAIFEAIIPSGIDERVPLGAADLPMARYADEVLAYGPTLSTFGIRAAVWLVTWFGPLLTGRPRRFTALSLSDRATVLGQLEHSSIYLVRELPTLLKMLATLGYCGAPAVQRSLGVTRVDEIPPSWMT